ncbi:uncharacterized protein LOC133391393 [Anopheles gambiae]|uniref:uncharacterized protein LOC133391393 n=1 Tax=Anopheles gambiae TaxID=7165 RepID=UPI002AC928AE|nr:uncharacterized protein LOC133391393 [Anopheles gambiae]
MGWPAFLNFRKNIRTHAAFVGVILILYAIFSILTGVAWWLEVKVQTGSDKIDYEVKAEAFSPKSKRSIDAGWSFNAVGDGGSGTTRLRRSIRKLFSSKSKKKKVNTMFSAFDNAGAKEAISHEINLDINQKSTQYINQRISQDTIQKAIQEINQEINLEIMFIKAGFLIMSIVSSFITIMYWIAYLKRQHLFLVIFIGLMTIAFAGLSIGLFVMIQQQKFIWACAMLFGFLVNGYVLTVALQLLSYIESTRRQHSYGAKMCMLPVK